MNVRIAVARIFSVVLGAALLIGASSAIAQPVDVPPTWGGDLWSRPRLTGSWGGLRDDLGARGVVIDGDLLLTPQGVLSGGIDTDWKVWGIAEYTLNVDTDKLGLWPGGFLKVVGQTGFGNGGLADVGALVPANTAAIVPQPNLESTALMNATITQFLSTRFGLFGGKIFALDGTHGEFTGNYRTQFSNMGLVIPMALDLVPISAYGGGIVIIPWKDALFSAMAIDPTGTPQNDDLGDAFDDGVTLLGSLSAKFEPCGLVGHQSVGGMWSSRNRLSLIQDLSNIVTLFAEENFPRLQDPGPILSRILERFFPGLLVPVEPANRDDDTWAVFYSFDQYFWQPEGDPESGIGIFFSFGAADDETSPVAYSYALGIGGKGIVPGRPQDTFGVGWARTEFSDHLVPLLRKDLNLGLDHEDAVEMYYGIAITSWLNLTLDLQVIETALEKKLGSGTNLKNVDTAVVGSLRTYIGF